LCPVSQRGPSGGVRMGGLKRLLRLVFKHWQVALAATLTTSLGVIVGLYIPLLFRRIVVEAIISRRPHLLPLLIGQVLALTALRGLLNLGHNYFSASLSQRTMRDLRDALYSKMVRLSMPFFDRHRGGALIARITSDVEVLERFVGFGLIHLGSSLLTFLGVLFFCLKLSPLLTAVALSSTPLLGLLSYTFATRLRPVFTEVRRLYAAMAGTAREALAGLRVLKAFASEPFQERKFEGELGRLLEKEFEGVGVWSKFIPIMNFASGLGMLAVLWFGGYLVVKGSITFGTLVAFNSYLFMLFWPVRFVGMLTNLSQRAAVAAGRVFEILDTPPDVPPPPRPFVPKRLRGEIEFQSVLFGYDPKRPVLKGLSLRVGPGERVAIVGPTGSGKSTLLWLAARFYDPQRGRVLLDGRDIRDYDLAFLHRNISIVPQEPILFSATVRENIAFGRPEASQEEIERAAELAQIHHFISSLPEGYDTVVGERGYNLSGGERQRVALARALLVDAPILLLDDFTSQVDAETEAAIVEGLEGALEGKTCIIVAHRLSVLKLAHRVLVLEEGRISGEFSPEGVAREFGAAWLRGGR